MAKKDKKKRQDQATSSLPSVSQGPILSKRGWKVIGAGILTVVIGFIVLSFTDPRGQNLASHVSPFLIIVGYALIGIGIITKDPNENSK